MVEDTKVTPAQERDKSNSLKRSITFVVNVDTKDALLQLAELHMAVQHLREAVDTVHKQASGLTEMSNRSLENKKSAAPNWLVKEQRKWKRFELVTENPSQILELNAVLEPVWNLCSSKKRCIICRKVSKGEEKCIIIPVTLCVKNLRLYVPIWKVRKKDIWHQTSHRR